MTIDYGPQHAGDEPFTARVRFHQSWYRATVLGVGYGTGPQPHHRCRFGNMLDAEAGAKGLNFLTPGSFDVARRRIALGAGVEPFRCLRNMLSSQPMCFNLFGPLVHDHTLATRVMRAALPGEVGEVTDVRIEYAPSPKGEYLNDRTSFDAFVSYVRPDGELAFLGIETKLTDTFSEHEYDGPTYRRFTECEPSLWRRDAWPYLASSRWNQLWRNHLLVESLCRHRTPAHGTPWPPRARASSGRRGDLGRYRSVPLFSDLSRRHVPRLGARLAHRRVGAGCRERTRAPMAR